MAHIDLNGKSMTMMKFPDVATMMSWMSAARDTVLSNAACEVTWLHRKSCSTLSDRKAARRGADQKCPCGPYALLTIRHGDGGSER
jgi:hypothetical protein